MIIRVAMKNGVLVSDSYLRDGRHLIRYCFDYAVTEAGDRFIFHGGSLVVGYHFRLNKTH